MQNPSEFTIDYVYSETLFKTVAEAEACGRSRSRDNYLFVGVVRYAVGTDITFMQRTDIELPPRITNRRIAVHNVEYGTVYMVRKPARTTPITEAEWTTQYDG